MFFFFLLLSHVLLQFRTFGVTWLEEEFLWYFYYFLYSLSTRPLKLILCFGIGAPAILSWVKKVCLCSSAGVLWERCVLHGADCFHGVWLVISHEFSLCRVLAFRITLDGVLSVRAACWSMGHFQTPENSYISRETENIY